MKGMCIHWRVQYGAAMLFVACLSLTGCSQKTPTPTAPPAPPPVASAMKLVVDYNPWPGNFPILVAKEQGFYKKYGLEVECVMREDSQQEIAEFMAKNCDGAGLALGSCVLIAAREADVAFILVADKSDGADAIVAIPGIESPRALKGKRLGVMLGGFGELFALEMLERAGVSPEDVVMKAMDGSDVPGMLAKGEIDAGQTWEPFVGQSLQSAQAHPIYTSRESDLVLDGFVFHRSTLRDKPEAVRAFVKGWYDGVDFCLAHPAEASALLMKLLNKPAAEVSFDGMKLFTREDNRKAFDTPESPSSVYTIFRRFAEFYARKGNVNVLIEPKQAVDSSFL